MFVVFNKGKIYSYIVALSTVIILFIFSAVIINQNNNIIQTSTSVERLLPIYNVKTDDKKIALTINCAWNADDIDDILEILNKTNIKITFFLVGNWIEKYPESVKKIYENGHEIRKSF